MSLSLTNEVITKERVSVLPHAKRNLVGQELLAQVHMDRNKPLAQSVQ